MLLHFFIKLYLSFPSGVFLIIVNLAFIRLPAAIFYYFKWDFNFIFGIHLKKTRSFASFHCRMVWNSVSISCYRLLSHTHLFYSSHWTFFPQRNQILIAYISHTHVTLFQNFFCFLRGLSHWETSELYLRHKTFQLSSA